MNAVVFMSAAIGAIAGITTYNVINIVIVALSDARRNRMERLARNGGR